MSDSAPLHSSAPDLQSPSRRNRLKETVDKLGRSISGRSSPASPASSAHRRLFSVNRRGKTKEKSTDLSDGIQQLSVLTRNLNQHIDSNSRPSSPVKSPPDDSPFITPPSPTFRPSLASFRGDGSVNLVGSHILADSALRCVREHRPLFRLSRLCPGLMTITMRS